jgi:hypothetical protein
MNSIEAHTLALVSHPSSPTDAVRAVGARVARALDGMLALTYWIEGDLSRIQLPPPRPTRRADGLWRHTCLEAFIAPDSGSSYLELNFSPSGEWASYTFSDYRAGMAEAENIEAPTILLSRSEGCLSVDVSVCLSGLCGGAAARLGLAAIIEGSGGDLSYWALAHPPGKPDFHHPRGLSLRI